MPPIHTRARACVCVLGCVCLCVQVTKTAARARFQRVCNCSCSLHFAVARASPGLQRAAAHCLSCYQPCVSVCSVVFCCCAPAVRNKHPACWSQHEQYSCVDAHAAHRGRTEKLTVDTLRVGRSWQTPSLHFRSLCRFCFSHQARN